MEKTRVMATKARLAMGAAAERLMRLRLALAAAMMVMACNVAYCDDVEGGFKKVLDFIFKIAKYGGIAILAYGIVQVVFGFMNQEGGGERNVKIGLGAIAGGLVLAFAGTVVKGIVSY